MDKNKPYTLVLLSAEYQITHCHWIEFFFSQNNIFPKIYSGPIFCITYQVNEYKLNETSSKVEDKTIQQNKVKTVEVNQKMKLCLDTILCSDQEFNSFSPNFNVGDFPTLIEAEGPRLTTDRL